MSAGLIDVGGDECIICMWRVRSGSCEIHYSHGLAFPDMSNASERLLGEIGGPHTLSWRIVESDNIPV